MFTGLNFAILSFFLTFTKFVMNCIYGSMPVIDDNLISFIIASNTFMWSYLATYAQLFLNPSKNAPVSIDQIRLIP